MRFDFKFVVFLKNKTAWKASLCFVFFFFSPEKLAWLSYLNEVKPYPARK